MNSTSDRELSLEELKQRNKTQPPQEPMPNASPLTQEKLDNLFYNQNIIWNGVVGLQEQVEALQAKICSIQSQMNSLPTQAELIQIGKILSQIQQTLLQAGRRNARRISLPHLSLPRLSPALLLIPVILIVCWAVWYSWGMLWSGIKMLHP